MAEEIQFGISLKDHMSGPAKEVANSLANMGTSISAASKQVSLLAESQKSASNSLSNLSTSTGNLNAELAPAISEAGALTGGLALLGAAAAATAGAIAYLTIKGALFAIQASQGKQAMIGMFAALGGGRAQGEEIESMLGGLSEAIGMTKDELAPLVSHFQAMGIEGTSALKKVTLAAASAQAIMGSPAAAQAFESLTAKIQVAAQTGQQLKLPEKALKSLAAMGLTVSDVALEMGISAGEMAKQLEGGTVNASKFGNALQEALIKKGKGPLATMASGFESIKKMIGQSFGDMFEDLSKAVDPFMVQVKDLFSIFGEATPSGKAMKAGITGAFTAIFGAASKVVPYVKHFFLDVIILSLKAYIFLKKHWTEISVVLKGAALIVGALAISFVAAVAVFTAPFIIAAAAVGIFVTGISYALGKVVEFVNGAKSAGSDFVDGFVKGITDGISSVTKAATDMAKAAADSVTNFLGISSPAKLMIGFGGHTGTGFAQGIQGKVGATEKASMQLGSAAVSGTTAGLKASDYAGAVGATTANATPASNSSSMGNITIQITAPDGVTDAIKLTEVAVAALFERLALSQGLA